jgi:predicted RNA-binding protein (virulence factor B family)
MIQIGRTQRLKVDSESPSGYLLSAGDRKVLLPRKLAGDAVSVGDVLEVFVYTDSEDRPIATTQNPLAQVGDFACLKVVDENLHGAFLDWGLDKDLFVPRSQQHEPMVVGRSYVVAVYLDTDTERVAAASLGEFFDYDLSRVELGAKVPLLVYGENDRGIQVLVCDRYSGLLYRTETFIELKMGDRLDGFVSAIRDDNKLDIRLKQTGVRGQKDAASLVMDALIRAGGKLPLGDRSPPEAIHREFGLSKKAFKAAVGTLYKRGSVKPSPLQIVLVDQKARDDDR